MLNKFNRGLLGGSLILLITINIFNALNYFFHFAMARLLSIADYGVLATLYSLIYVLAVFSESIQTVISKYSTREKSDGKLKNILKKSLRKAVVVSSILFGIYLVAAIFISYYLKIEYPLVALTGVILFTMFLIPITRGALQGRKKFRAMGVNMIVESSIKFVFAILLVLLSWKVYGAMIATIVGAVVSFSISFFSLKDIFSAKEEKAETEGIYGYTAPVFSVILAISVFYSLDVILARIFFSAETAGHYAIASVLSKIIFFGTQPISKAMFPLSSESKNKKDSQNILASASLILCLAIVSALAIIYIFPDLLVRIFSGKTIPETAAILIFPAISIGLLSFTNLMLLHKLSLGKLNRYWILFLFVILEIVLLSYFHKNLFQYSLAYVAASAAFLWGSLSLLND